MTVYRNIDGAIFQSTECEDAVKAIDFALDELDDTYDRIDFLRDWREGEVSDWPDFIEFVGRSQ